jgi:hypothetical protein
MPSLQGVIATCDGTIYITAAQLYFRARDTEGVLVSIPHGCLERIRKVQGKEKTNQAYIIDLICKDLRTVRFALPGKAQYKQMVGVLESFAYELEIPQLSHFVGRKLKF